MLPTFTGVLDVQLLTEKQRRRLKLLRTYLTLKEYGYTLEQVAGMSPFQAFTALLKENMTRMAERAFWSDQPSPLFAALEPDA